MRASSLIFGSLACLVVVTGCATRPADSGATSVDRWVSRQGGCIDGDPACRARRALDALRVDDPTIEGLRGRPLTVAVLDCDRPTAYAWPCGRLYVSRGLVETLSDQELAAAIAHEAGHLMAEPAGEDRVALSGSHDNDACEMAADVAGGRLLVASGIPPSAMVSMLRKVAGASRTAEHLRPLLVRRAEVIAEWK